MSPLALLHPHIKRIVQHHPWYNTLLQQDGIDPQACQLSDLPLITSDILEQHYFTGRAREEEGLSVYKTSGTSSGVRKAIYYSKEDDENYIDAKTACFQDWMTASTAAEPPVPIRRAFADMGTGHAANTALTIFDRLAWKQTPCRSRSRLKSILRGWNPIVQSFFIRCRRFWMLSSLTQRNQSNLASKNNISRRNRPAPVAAQHGRTVRNRAAAYFRHVWLD